MARGKPVGTAYAELDLDSTKLEKGLTRSREMLISGSMKVEDAYKSLGLKSERVYEKMRENARLASDYITKNTIMSEQEMLRVKQAAADKITKLNEEQYGKQLSSIELIKKNWIAASAAIVAAWALVNKAIGYMDEAGKALQTESSFKIMADAAGVSSERMIASMKAATKETIDDSDLMQKAVKLMTLGYDPSQIERFSKVVITASQIAGTTAAEAYDQLADAIANKMPKALIRMGAVTREQMKIVNEAITKGADSMAIYELAMANLELKQKMLQGTQDQATIALQRFHAMVKETGESIGKGLIVVAQALYGSLQAIATAALYAAYGIAKTLEWSVKLAAWGADKLGLKEQAKAWREYADSVRETADNLKGAAGELKDKMNSMISGGPAGPRATGGEISAAKAKVDSQMKELATFKEAAKETQDSVTKIYHDGLEAYREQAKEYQRIANKAADENEAALRESSLKMLEVTEQAEKESLAAMAAALAEKNRLMNEQYKKELDDAKKFEEEKARILVEAEQRRTEMKTRTEGWAYESVSPEYMAEAEDRSARKAAERQSDMLKEQQAQLEPLKGVISEFSSIWASAFTNMASRTASFKDIFMNSITSMRDAFVQMVMQMMVKWAAFQALKMLTAAPTGGLSMGLPVYAEGGIVNRRTQAIIGERGPEAVIPLKNGAVPVKNLGGGGGSGGNTYVFISSPDAEGVQRLFERNSGALINVISDHLDNRGSLVDTIRSVS